MITLAYALTFFSLLLCLAAVLVALRGRAELCRRLFYAAGAGAAALFVADWVLAQAPPADKLVLAVVLAEHILAAQEPDMEFVHNPELLV